MVVSDALRKAASVAAWRGAIVRILD